jgi:hypothetical protein
MLLIDAHVHIYDCYNLEKFFDVAFENFQAAATQVGYERDFTGILLLAESSGCDWFGRLKILTQAEQSPQKNRIGSWALNRTGEDSSLIEQANGGKRLILIAGRQIVTAEGLELLALCTTDVFADGISIMESVAMVRESGGIPVIPWGFGKWMGRRGKILKELLGSIKEPKIFLGDNGGRPKFLKQPSYFKMADDLNIRILPGSDPLPFTSEYNRAGSFGFSLPGKISLDYPADQLKKKLSNLNNGLQTYGKSERPFRFFRNQIRMQIKKRFLR